MLRAQLHLFVIGVVMSWLGCLNFIVLQWFFVRLAKVVDDDGRTVRFTWLRKVVPLTGWWSDYSYVGRNT